MPIQTDCPGCGHSYKIPESRAGQSATCKRCGESFQVPKPAAAAAGRNLSDLFDDEEVSSQATPRRASDDEFGTYPPSRASSSRGSGGGGIKTILGGVGAVLLVVFIIVLKFGKFAGLAWVAGGGSGGGVRPEIVQQHRDVMTSITASLNQFAGLLEGVRSPDDLLAIHAQLLSAGQAVDSAGGRAQSLPKVTRAEIRALTPDASAFRLALARAAAAADRTLASPGQFASDWSTWAMKTAEWRHLDAKIESEFPDSQDPPSSIPASRPMPIATAPGLRPPDLNPGLAPGGPDSPFNFSPSGFPIAPGPATGPTGPPSATAPPPAAAVPPATGPPDAQIAANSKATPPPSALNMFDEMRKQVGAGQPSARGSAARSILERLDFPSTSPTEAGMLLSQLSTMEPSDDLRDDVMVKAQAIAERGSSHAATIRNAYSVLAKWAGPDHVELLGRAINAAGVPSLARRDMIAALGRIGDPDSLPALREAAADRSTQVKKAANEAIKAIESKS